jgi:diguanylate cyclase (GGDEF)-like protein
MPKSVKIGYEGVEIDLPLHALYIHRGTEQLIDNIFTLINDGIERHEKVVYIGNERTCKVLRKNFRTRISTVSKGVTAKSLVRWLKREYKKLPKTREGLRVLIECNKNYVGFENGLDDLSRQPDYRIFVLCTYDVSAISSLELVETLKTHPYVFVEHLIQPNCFYSRVKQQNWIDTLTGVFNKKYFDQQLHTELQRASRYEHSLAVILMDVDRFSTVNKEFDISTGDSVLQQLARILERSLRSVDILARYGSDEFAALLPETKKAYAKQTAQRILRSVRNHDFFKEDLRVKEISLSIGVVGFPEDAGGVKEMIKKAERSLRKAKRLGGSTVFAYD